MIMGNEIARPTAPEGFIRVAEADYDKAEKVTYHSSPRFLSPLRRHPLCEPEIPAPGFPPPGLLRLEACVARACPGLNLS